MMQTIQANGYPIYFLENGYEAFNQLLTDEKYSSIFVLVDEHSNEYCLPHFLAQVATELRIEVIEINSGENSKNIETCVQIWNVLTELGADRKSVVINLGGGVVTDIGGFVASTFKRGIDFVHVPTTLLAMVDAAIGGKNGVDLGNLKNQIGVINAPKIIIVDSGYLETLPKNEMRSGLAEMLKHGLVHDRTYWQSLSNLQALDFDDFDALIYRSIVIKNTIVMKDPTENGIRKALNFGHTLGHAIESYFLSHDHKNRLLHGEAIAAGMILESYLSWQKNLISEQEYSEIKQTINDLFERISFDIDDLEQIHQLLIHDKKNEYGTIQFALLDSIGKIKINQTAEKELITAAFMDYKT